MAAGFRRHPNYSGILTTRFLTLPPFSPQRIGCDDEGPRMEKAGAPCVWVGMMYNNRPSLLRHQWQNDVMEGKRYDCKLGLLQLIVKKSRTV